MAAVMVTAGMSMAQSGTLTMVPMQGGMVMPMVAYRAGEGRLAVTMPVEVPQLTPLLVSHPGDTFDPADPWFDALDPRRQGLSFSRRYGFVMDAMTDPLPPNTVMWIRLLSASPELGFYRYSASPPKQWEPIFGTLGSSVVFPWNGLMFHPAITAPPGSDPLTATFELVLADTITGEAIAGSGSGSLVLDFTNVPDGRPELEITLKVMITWPAETADYILETADALPAADWTPVPVTPALLDGRFTVLLEAAAQSRFFRLRPIP